MVFAVSPSVNIREIDLSSVVPNTSASDAAIVGSFQWGPVEQVTFIDNEDQLVSIFGKPTLTEYKDFLCASSFLAYASNLRVVRVVSDDALNATATETTGGTGLLVKNKDQYDTISFSSSANLWVAKWAGTLGNSIGVAWADTAGFDEQDTNGDYVWPFRSSFSSAPDANEFHVAVYDVDGGITGTVGALLEVFDFVSTVSTAKDFSGKSAYVKDVINTRSNWLWVGKVSLLSGTSDGVTLAAGVNGTAITDDERIEGWQLFQNSEEYDISLAIAGGADSTTSKWIIDNVAEYRKDLVAFVSPMEDDVVDALNPTVAVTASKSTRNIYGSSSYAFMDSVYKLMYDRYNDVDRWVPLNGDTAGLAARATNENDAWWSPAGYERGRIKNCLKLSYIQGKSERDELYKAGINPVISKANTGPMLYGDKTLQVRASAFDRIGVRRLFIVLEKSIANAAEAQLFEFNDDIQRAKFTNMVEPFLQTVKGRRGLTKFKVVCDTSNNTEEVIARNEFVASIFILPNYSTNFIQLNFVAVNNSVLFDEIIVR
jgi:hypothetical protein